MESLQQNKYKMRIGEGDTLLSTPHQHSEKYIQPNINVQSPYVSDRFFESNRG